MHKRILAVDFGLKRTGLAMSGPLLIAINPLDTVPTAELMEAILRLAEQYEIGTIVFGDTKKIDGTPNKQTSELVGFLRKLKTKLTEVKIELEDEAFTSIEAKQLMIDSGVKKKKRRTKALVDQMSAVIILKRYLESTQI